MHRRPSPEALSSVCASPFDGSTTGGREVDARGLINCTLGTSPPFEFGRSTRLTSVMSVVNLGNFPATRTSRSRRPSARPRSYALPSRSLPFDDLSIFLAGIAYRLRFIRGNLQPRATPCPTPLHKALSPPITTRKHSLPRFNLAHESVYSPKYQLRVTL